MTPHEKQGIEVPISEELALHEIFEEEKKRKFPESLIIIAKHKWLVGSFVFGVAVLSAVISLFLTKHYTAKAKLLPPQQNQSVAATMLSQLGPLGGLVGNMGLNIRNPNDMYVAMLRSDSVTYALVDRFSLVSLYHQKLRSEARAKLELLTEVSVDKNSGVISISVDDTEPDRAAKIANAYIEELEKLTRTLAVTDASKRRIFFEHEAQTANEELVKAEQALKQTEEETGLIQLDSQARVMLQAYADLRAAVTAKQVEIQAMESFATPDNPDLIRAKQELKALQAQVAHYEEGQGGRPIGDIALEKVPAKALAYIQKLREVKYREALLELMLKQYEIARIDEAKDSYLIQVLDKALPPDRRSWPKRTAIVMASTLLASILAVLAALMIEKIRKAREDPQFAAQLQLFNFYLWGSRK
jgi:tyrosine-protein kinase Etk/Wzc